MKELELEATVENLDEVLAFVDKQLEEFGCPMKTQMQVDIAVEEIFVNIAHYGDHTYRGKAGSPGDRAYIYRSWCSI